MVLLSAAVERVGVSRVRDFLNFVLIDSLKEVFFYLGKIVKGLDINMSKFFDQCLRHLTTFGYFKVLKKEPFF